ncbi:hypothetical protein IFM89_000314 [Coptis chinensis]|uniref:UspA domain-containing protein n=1 Tax=Coptis chinensis TaxID=261450 RepID=A0A835H8S7_9MAGN|nr:hypothetical protein IFM89_000314 [Coptis chinensis]
MVHMQLNYKLFTVLVFPTAVYATTMVIESVKKAQEQNSAMLLSRAVQICKEKPIKVETVVLDGDPKDMICQAAEQTHPDIVVVRSRGLSKLKRAFLGSVSDYCAHHVKCPILIVKPPK